MGRPPLRQFSASPVLGAIQALRGRTNAREVRIITGLAFHSKLVRRNHPCQADTASGAVEPPHGEPRLNALSTPHRIGMPCVTVLLNSSMPAPSLRTS